MRGAITIVRISGDTSNETYAQDFASASTPTIDELVKAVREVQRAISEGISALDAAGVRRAAGRTERVLDEIQATRATVIAMNTEWQCGECGHVHYPGEHVASRSRTHDGTPLERESLLCNSCCVWRAVG